MSHAASLKASDNAPITCEDWGNLANEDGLLALGRNRYPCTYVIYTDGTNYFAENGTTGALDFGGPNNRGGVSGISISAVLQAAVNATPSGGGAIIFRAGTYNGGGNTVTITASRILLKGESMSGEGGDWTVYFNELYLSFNAGTRYYGGIENIWFNSAGVVNNLVTVVDYPYFMAKNCYFIGGDEQLLLTARTHYAEIMDNTFKNGNLAIHIDDTVAGAPGAGRIFRCVFSSLTAGIDIHLENAGSWILDSNYFEANGPAVVNHIYNEGSAKIIIANCTFGQSNAAHMYHQVAGVADPDNCRIHHCDFEGITGGAHDAILVQAGDNFEVDNCYFNIATARTAVYIAAGDYARISHNHIQATGSHAIQTNGDFPDVSGNIVLNSGGRGITGSGDHPSIIGNYVKVAAGYGIYAGGVEARIEGNGVYGCTGASGYGIYSNGADHEIIGNICQDNAQYGCTIQAVNATVLGNDLTNNVVGSLLIGGGATAPIVKSNKGYNPVAASLPAVGASPVTFGPYPYPAMIGVVGGTITSVTIRTQATGQVGAGTFAYYVLYPTDTCIIVYTVAPTVYLYPQ